ncbi:hypothetical protein [Clostridium formicaceticum]|uniref:Uncharacterized protein n=1 Tax=Clostridium formicaceticum TaxID=1497 RepID=A0AAC9RMK3_9CLOT|nr:hypothetical protein [Clostridium formicaceticum]AOY76627.1 hypothetical protein BJL90_12590 [Clostridium formicaceticum]ARE87050.1 hypothetical protein CLFO_14360 [Clostridium formicaceticum]
MISEGFDLIEADYLMSFAGAVIATNVITHFIKDYMPEFLDKKIVTLFVAAFIMFTNQCIFGTITLKTMYLSFLNSFVVAAAAMGNYEILTTKTKKRVTKDLQNQASKKSTNEKTDE